MRAGGSSERSGAIPALDGVRGCAILLVLISHVHGVFLPWLGANFLPGSALGVDIFFVLSGYLITSILLKARARGGVGFVSFYRGRAMRLLPALVVFLAAQIIYAWIMGSPRKLEQSSVVAVLLYYSNWRKTIFFPPGISHLWSLAVEEQFYLVWPSALVILLGITRGRRRLVAAAVVAAIVAVVIVRAVSWNHGTLWLWLYQRTDTRADSLLVGALLAIVGPQLASRFARWVAPAAWVATAVVALFVGFARVDRAPLYLGGYTVLAAATAIVILASLPGSTWQGTRALEWRPLRILGIVSYGVYLWHGLIFDVVQQHGAGIPTAPRTLLALAITAVAVYLSWVVVEQPFLRWKRRLDSRRATTSPPPDEVATEAQPVSWYGSA